MKDLTWKGNLILHLNISLEIHEIPLIYEIFVIEARDVLRTHREQNIRQSQKVVDLWDHVLKKSLDKLGDESTYQVVQVYEITQFLIYKLSSPPRIRGTGTSML